MKFLFCGLCTDLSGFILNIFRSDTDTDYFLFKFPKITTSACMYHIINSVFSISSVMVLSIRHWFKFTFRFIMGISHPGFMLFAKKTCIPVFVISIGERGRL